MNKFKVTTEVRAILQDSLGIKTMVGDKIFPLVAPNGTEGDFIIYQRDGFKQEYTKMGVARQVPTIFVTAVSDNYTRSQELASLIYDALEGDFVDPVMKIRMEDSTEDYENISKSCSFQLIDMKRKTKILKTMATKLDSSKDIYRGELMLFIGDEPIAFASSCGLDVSTEEIDISNKMMGDWAGSLPGKKSFTLSSESLLTRKEGAMSFDTLLSKQITGEVLDFFLGSSASTDKDNFGGTFTKDTKQKNYTGKVIITSLSIKSDNGQIVSCSASFKGIGALAPVEPVGVGG